MTFPTPLWGEGRGEGLAEPFIPIIQRAFDFNVALRFTVAQVVGGGRARGPGVGMKPGRPSASTRIAKAA